jgi:xanthine dehydrogenase small subunit
MRDQVVLFINGKRYAAGGTQAFATLSNYLRYDLGLTGTKVVCAEGDCGSCSVLVGRAEGETIQYRAVTSCIQFLYQLDGAHVITIEGLRYEGELNPVQQAMVKCQGSQCGFCTPGFVVSMCGLFNERRNLDERALRAGLVGNLCRCTGYEPILRAGLEVARHELHTLNELYPPVPMLVEMKRAREEAVLVEADGRKFFKPVTVREAVEFKAANPDATPVAGATDVGVQVNKQIRNPRSILALGSIAELRGIELDDGVLSIGAAATLSELERRCEELAPEFAKMLWRHGSPLIRNAGTLAGNIANGSPIGDTMPALFVLNTEVELTGIEGSRRVNMNDFYTGYRKTVMKPDEIITRVLMPLPLVSDQFRIYKLSKRHDLDISTFTAAMWMRLEEDVIAEIRIAYGGVGPVIYRLQKTEQALKGKPFTSAEIEGAVETAVAEISPIGDVRGSREYRLAVAGNILRKFHAEISGEATYERITRGGRTISAGASAPAPNHDGNGNGKAH